jgi:hypothetical protein
MEYVNSDGIHLTHGRKMLKKEDNEKYAFIRLLL